MVVSVRGDESNNDLDVLKEIDATMLFHDLPYSEDKVSRVHAARRYNNIPLTSCQMLYFPLFNILSNVNFRLFEYLSENGLSFPVIHHIQFPKGTHR